MKRLLLWLLAWLAAHPAGWAQAIRPPGDTTSLNQDLRAAFSTLAPGRTTTGIVMDQTAAVSGWHDFGGTGTPKVNTYANWQQQYHEYYNACFSQSGRPTPAAVAATVRQRVSPGHLALTMLSFRYDELKPDAVSNGLIRVDSTAGRLYDEYPEAIETPGSYAKLSTPYRTRQLFAVALAGAVPLSGDVEVWVGKDLWLGTDRAPDMLTIDFGDNQGTRAVSMDSWVTLHYGAINTRAGQRGAGGPAIISVTAGSLTATSTLARSTSISVEPDAGIELYAANVWPGQPRSTAVGWVKWGAGNDGTQRKFRRPLVFVEGIDFGCDGSTVKPCFTLTTTQTGWMNKQESNWGTAQVYGSFRSGDVGWNEMVDYRQDFPAVEKLPGLRAALTAQGYDIIFLDFTDGAALIQSNAMTLVELLEFIDNNRDTSWRDAQTNQNIRPYETIVTAASMGGQVARFALAWMEQEHKCHNAKLYVSIDSPHRGANIPLGLQAMIQRLRYTFTGGEIKPKWNSLNRPAAQQMLVYHINEEAGPLRTAWQSWQASPGSYPTHLRKVAVADGNRFGTILQNGSGGSQFGGQELLKTNPFAPATLLFGDWGENYVNALPGAESRGNPRVVYRYRRPLRNFYQWNYVQAPTSVLNYDLAPGGTRSTTADIEREHSFLFTSGSAYQTFIPTVSALDVSAAGSNLFYNVGANIIDPKLPDPSKYAFEAYYAPDGISEPHINISNGQPTEHPDEDPPIPNYGSNNSAWILNELAESAHRLPASFDGVTRYPAATSPGATTALVSPYNFGSLYRRLLPTVEIGYNGHLFINNNNLPVSGGVNTASVNKQNSFEMYTSSCGSRVVVSYIGKLTLGQPNDNHTATVRIGYNSLLDLGYGSTTVINAGSTLRIEAGGTLLVRAGSALTIYGTVVIETGGYLCIENPASVTTPGGGSLLLQAGTYQGTNPALGLSTGSCQAPACTPQLGLAVTGDCAGQAATFTATGTNVAADYRWTVDGVAQPQLANQGQVTYELPNDSRTSIQVVVTVSSSCAGGAPVSATQQVPISHGQDCQNSLTSNRVELYPNPAHDHIAFNQSAAARPAATAAPAPAPAEYSVRLYDGQGQLRWQGQSRQGQLGLGTAGLPRGLYGVVITQGGTVMRRTLSLE